MNETNKKMLLVGGVASSLLIGGILVGGYLGQEALSRARTPEQTLRSTPAKEATATEQHPQKSQKKETEPSVSELYERAGLRPSFPSSLSLLTGEDLKEVALVMTAGEKKKAPSLVSLPRPFPTRPVPPEDQEKEPENDTDVIEPPLGPPTPIQPELPEIPEVPKPPVDQVDYSVLQGLVLEGKQIDTQHYLSTGGVRLKEQLRLAKQLIQHQLATQAIVNRQSQMLRQAMDQLVEKGDKTLLAQQIEEANQFDLTLYTTTSVTEFKQRFLQIYLVYQQSELTQPIIDEHVVLLDQAVAQLVRRGDKTALRALVDQVNQIDRELYTLQSLVALVAPMLESDALLKDIDATQPQLDGVYERLIHAYQSLQEKEEPALSLVYLKRLIAACEQLNEAAYTPNSFAAFLVVLNQARELIQQENLETLTEEAVKFQIEALTQAKQALVEKADKEALRALIAEVATLQPEDYTTESWVVFEQALLAANECVIDENATQTQVDDAIVALRQARDCLEIVEQEPQEVLTKEQDSQDLPNEQGVQIKEAEVTQELK